MATDFTTHFCNLKRDNPSLEITPELRAILLNTFAAGIDHQISVTRELRKLAEQEKNCGSTARAVFVG